jgi:hypothetical protein
MSELSGVFGGGGELDPKEPANTRAAKPIRQGPTRKTGKTRKTGNRRRERTARLERLTERQL